MSFLPGVEKRCKFIFPTYFLKFSACYKKIRGLSALSFPPRPSRKAPGLPAPPAPRSRKRRVYPARRSICFRHLEGPAGNGSHSQGCQRNRSPSSSASRSSRYRCKHWGDFVEDVEAAGAHVASRRHDKSGDERTVLV